MRFPRLNLKNINRLVVLSLVFAPLVYLFGSLFTALNGANGAQLFHAQEASTYSWSSFSPTSLDDFSSSSSYRFVFNSPFTYSNSVDCTVTSRFSADGVDGSYNTDNQTFNTIRIRDNYVRFYTRSDFQGFYLNIDLSSFYPRYLYFNSFSSGNIYGGFLALLNYGVFEVGTPVTYTDLSYQDVLFSDLFFDDKNFLVRMGKDALEENDIGFYPANALISILDENVLHYGSGNNVALMAYGYSVWVFNVVIIDLAVYLSLWLFLLPLKATEIFDRKDKEL